MKNKVNRALGAEKKIFTMLMGTIIALSASAIPNPAARKAPTELKDVRKEIRHVPAIQNKTNAETIVIEANNLSIDLSMFDLYLTYMQYGYLSVSGENTDYYVHADLITQTENYYTTYSTAEGSVKLTVYDSEENEIALNVSAAELEKTEKGDRFTAEGTDEKGNSYYINLTLFAPDAPKSTVSLDFEKVDVQYISGSGEYYLYGEREDYVVSLDIYTNDLEGKFGKSDFYMQYTHLFTINGTDTVSVGNAYDANAEIVLQDGVYNIAAELFLTDSVLYKINMSYAKPEAKDTVRHTFAEPVSVDNFGEDWYLEAEDENYVLYFDYYSKTIAGEFSLKNGDLNTEYIALFLIGGTDTTFVRYEDVKAVITEDETGYDIVIDYFGTNGNYYIFNLRSEKAKAEQTVKVNDDAATLTDYTATVGQMFRVVGTSADPQVTLYITVNSPSLEGIFKFNDILNQYSAAEVGKVQYQFVDGEFTSVVESNILTLEGWVLAKNNVKYEFVLKAVVKTTGLENAETGMNASKRVESGILVIEKAGVQYDAQGARIQ